MSARWNDIAFLFLYNASFALLWRLSARLHNPRFGRFLWDSFIRICAITRRLWVFSAETTQSQEVEFINEHPVDFSTFLSWFAKVLLSVVYLIVLLIWVLLSINKGNG
jgi:hypothetical protein